MNFNEETLTIIDIEFYTDMFEINWKCNIGFGQCSFFYDNDTKEWTVESECMSKEFVQALLKKAFQTININ